MAGDITIMETTSPMNTSFAIWLLRQSRGMTQKQLAARMNTTRQQVSDLEIGQLPTIHTLLRLSRALQVNPAALLRIAEARGVSVLPHSENRARLP